VSAPEFALVVSVFLACAVEAVEALTIVLAVGSTRSWSSSLYGCGTATLALAALVAALAAVALVALTGLAVRAPLARVPENMMKFAVGVMLTSFGTFWGTQGAGASWPGGDAALLAIIPGVALVSLAMVLKLRRVTAAATLGEAT
jgi:uncharacterized membrane protein